MSEENFNYTNPLNIVVAFLIIAIGIFGVICNSLIIYVFIKEKSEKTAFNLICFCRAISNVSILTIGFLLNFFPKTLLGFSLYPPVLESWFINIANTLYLGNEYQIVLVALNRFYALFFPIQYSRIFAIPQTTAVLGLIYIYRIIKKIVEVVPEHENGCYALFYTDALAWHYDSSEQCNFNSDALNIVLYTLIAITIVNLISFAKIVMFYRKNNNKRKGTRRRMRKNRIMFLQTMLQDSLYLVDLTFTFKLASWSTHRVWTYFSGTFIWECLHSIDGFIMVMFNEKLSLWKKRIANISVIPIIALPRR